MRVRLERTYLTTPQSTRILYMIPDHFLVDAASLHAAIVQFIENGGGRLLGSVTQLTESRAVATGWSEGRLFMVSAEPAPD